MMITGWEPTPNHTPLTWTIWGVILILFLSVILLSIGYLYWKLYKDQKKLFTIKKVVFFATFLSISIILTFIESLIGKQFHISLDYVIPVVVGFVYGPLEGIVLAWTSDTLNVLIHGWGYSIFSSLLLPMIGLLSGVMGIFYERSKDKERGILFSTLLVQLSIIFCSIILTSMILVSTMSPLSLVSKNSEYILFVSMAVILFISSETIYFYFLYKKDSDNLLLFSLVLITMLISRTLGTIVTPFQQYFAGFTSLYEVSLFKFMMHSSYVVPLETLLSYFFIKMTLDFDILY